MHKRGTGVRALVVSALFLGLAGVSQAQNVIDDVNVAMENIIQNTSASLIDGPPEVANEIALVDGAMYDAVNAASGLAYAPLYYTGGPVAGANASAAALQAALTVMNNLYGSGSLYQQYAGDTGASYYGGSSAYKNALVGPTLVQMNQVMADIAGIQTELNNLGVGTAITTGIALGTAAGTAANTANALSGSQTAMLATLTYSQPANPNLPGVYVAPTTRPELQPTWGSVAPIGISTSSLAYAETLAPGPQPLNSTTYANEVLQTECEGAGSALPMAVEAACTTAGFKPESAAEAQAALFWNDPGGTLQPPGHWLQIADTVTGEEGLDLLSTARADALTGIAMDDAGIATWAVKYNDNAWRPITAITGGIGGADCPFGVFTNCDPGWTSLIATPPHPDYIAGHPAFSGSAATALAAALGNDDVTFTSTSNTYCNGGSSTIDADGNTTGCTQNNITYSISGAGCANSGTIQYDSDGAVIGCFVGATLEPLVGGSCPTAGRIQYDSSPAGTVTGCLVGGVAETVTGGGCNNADSQPVLNQDGTANLLYNSSPLICPIAETFDSLSQASGGYLGAEYSRVVGGIHTPDAVIDALAVGDEIGTLVASEDLPEPPMAPVVAAGLLILGALRYRRRFGASRAG